MKNLDEIFVSSYANKQSKKPKERTLLEVLNMCVSPTYATRINQIRALFANGDEKGSNRLKGELPGFTYAGTFKGGHAIKEFDVASGIVCLDYDHVDNRLEVIERCKKDVHTVAALESPRDGVKFFVHVEDIGDRYELAQRLLAKRFDKVLGIKSDGQCKDVSRLCFYTYSPNGYVATQYESLSMEELMAESEADGVVGEEVHTNAGVGIEPGIELSSQEAEEKYEQELADEFLIRYVVNNPLSKGERNSTLFKMACEACRRGIKKENLLRGLKNVLSETDFSQEETYRTLSSGYKSVIENPEQNKPADEKNAKDRKGSLGPRTPYAPNFSTSDAEEDYWEGEEFRKHTPLIPAEVYNNLPELLRDCMAKDYSLRERDVSLLSNIISLSAVMPNTEAIYNHKRYSPCLFLVINAPAGSNKSVALTGRYLLLKVHDKIAEESDKAVARYNEEYKKWQDRGHGTRKKRKKGESTEEAEVKEPMVPPYRLLFIPAATSHSRMEMQLRDNGEQASIIFDTEAETMVNANAQDYGGFQDMLRKAFEHEEINSSYKINGMRPITVRRPQLSMVLTGTPGQIDSLLANYENGLFSRILTYTYREDVEWKDMGDEFESTEDVFAPLARRVAEMYEFCLKNKMEFHFNQPQWNRLNSTFSKMLKEAAIEANEDLTSVVKRYACMVMRMGMVLTRLRQLETLLIEERVYCSEEDFDSALRIVLCCYEHSRLLHSSMEIPTFNPLNNPYSIRDFIKALPEYFTTEDANKAGEVIGFSKRKVKRVLSSSIGVYISRLSRGKYKKY